MIQLIEERREAIAKLCRQRRVLRLEAFGSAVSGEFDPRGSDLDFLVEFLPLEEGGYFDAYFGLMEDLRDLFGREIDLVMTAAIKNRYFLESVNRNRTVLYAA